MIVLLRLNTPKSEYERVHAMLLTAGCDLREAESSGYRILFADKHWNHPPLDLISSLSASQWVESVIHGGTKHPLIAGRPSTEVRVGDVSFGSEFVLIAGPCTLESERAAVDAARSLRDAGAKLFRGGAFKPTTSPYSFGGLGKEGLTILSAVKQETGLGIVTEVMDVRLVDAVADVADVLQIGARNMQNFDLLREVGRRRKPVLLKRGFGARIDEWLSAAEYIAGEGNDQIILCERGIRTFESATRATLDVSSPSVVASRARLPVIADPSHAAGDREFVIPLALAAVAAGACGLMVEAAPKPEEAIKDGGQTIDLQALANLRERAEDIYAILNGQRATSC